MDVAGIAIGILGLVIGIVVAWWFYRKHALDSERMEQRILEAVLGIPISPRVITQERGHEHNRAAPSQQWGWSALEQMQNPEDLVRRIAALLKQGEIFWPELDIVARSLIKAGNVLAEIAAQQSEAAQFRLHGKVREASAAEAEVERKLGEMLDG